MLPFVTIMQAVVDFEKGKKPEKSRVSREVFFSSTKIDIVLFDSCAVDAVDHL